MGDAEIHALLHDALMRTVTRMESHFVQAGGFTQLGCGVVATTKRDWCESSMRRLDALTQRLVDLGGDPDYAAKPLPRSFVGGIAEGHLQDLEEARALQEVLARLAERARERGDAETAQLAEAHYADEARRVAWIELELRELERLGHDEYQKARALPEAPPGDGAE